MKQLAIILAVILAIVITANVVVLVRANKKSSSSGSTTNVNTKNGSKSRLTVKPPRSLEQLFEYPDGPKHANPKEWTEFKRALYAKGMLGHYVDDQQIYHFRRDPKDYAALFDSSLSLSQ